MLRLMPVAIVTIFLAVSPAESGGFFKKDKKISDVEESNVPAIERGEVADMREGAKKNEAIAGKFGKEMKKEASHDEGMAKGFGQDMKSAAKEDKSMAGNSAKEMKKQTLNEEKIAINAAKDMKKSMAGSKDFDRLMKMETLEKKGIYPKE